jgi:hypothetical protein
MPYRFAFLIEQTLGHVTHAQNLTEAVARDASIAPAWLPVPYQCDDRYSRLPLVRSNWTLKLSLRARRQLRCAGGPSRFDAVFFHTQVIAHASLDLMRQVPAVVSLDATPMARAAMESANASAPQQGLGAGLRQRWTAAVFRRAAAIVAWSRWAAESVSRDYGVDPAKVRVIPPGVDLQAWRPLIEHGVTGGVPRVLFVGGDFVRKGGPALIDTLGDVIGRSCELHLVTGAGNIPARPGLHVHRGLKPNSDALRRLTAECDIFALPTRKDFMPLAILEAMACGLPVVATRLGGIPEQVEDGVSGILVPPNDPAALASALRGLLADEARRRQMGRAGRSRAERLFCAEQNARMLTGLMKQLVDERSQTAPAKGEPNAAAVHS